MTDYFVVEFGDDGNYNCFLTKEKAERFVDDLKVVREQGKITTMTGQVIGRRIGYSANKTYGRSYVYERLNGLESDKLRTLVLTGQAFLYESEPENSYGVTVCDVWVKE